MTQRIAFVGLGNMGLPMAQNLAKAGYDVTGFDMYQPAREAAQSTGLTVSPTLAQAILGRQVVVLMLPNGAIVRSVVADIAEMVTGDLQIIDCSTIDIATTRIVAASLVRHNVSMIDAPVSGGTAGAAAGTLTFMCGGEAGAFELAKPFLSAMGKRIVHCGPIGAGQAAKICNNMILAVSMIAVCEAFNLADQIGLDRQAMFDVVSASSGSCWSLNTYCPVPGVGPISPADNGYAPGFSAALMLKDLSLAQDAAVAAGVETPMGRTAQEAYQSFVEAGSGHVDFSAIIHALDAMGGKVAQ